VGAKKNAIWRIVAADQRSPRDGRNIEILGQYNPQTEPSTIAVNEERVRHWVAVGATATPQVRKLLRTQGINISSN
jgi:small subunit ribosomal protein S16